MNGFSPVSTTHSLPVSPSHQTVLQPLNLTRLSSSSVALINDRSFGEFPFVTDKVTTGNVLPDSDLT
ncbi:hypothetical protein D3C76_1715160 [compost metagenome]